MPRSYCDFPICVDEEINIWRVIKTLPRSCTVKEEVEFSHTLSAVDKGLPPLPHCPISLTGSRFLIRAISGSVYLHDFIAILFQSIDSVWGYEEWCFLFICRDYFFAGHKVMGPLRSYWSEGIMKIQGCAKMTMLIGVGKIWRTWSRQLATYMLREFFTCGIPHL